MPRYPDGPKGRFFGLSLARQFQRRPLEFITEMGRVYPDAMAMRLGPIRLCVLNQPQAIHELLVTKNKSFRRPERAVRPLRCLDGNGLVLSDGDFWLRQRRLVQPAFHTRRFDHYADITIEYTWRMLERWSEKSSLDVADEMTRLTLEIIARTLFDVELTKDASQLSEAVRVMSQIVVREAGSPLTLPDWLPLPSKRRKRWALRTLDEMVWSVIRRRRQDARDQGDLLSMLLLAVDEQGDGRGMTDVQARDEAMTLFNAGHDSTAAALAWIWYLVARHPEAEDKLVGQIDSALGGRRATYADVSRLPYVEMVVKESLRLYPPTWVLLPREAISDVEIGDYAIPKGTWVYVFPWLTHRDARYFENPLKFDPERFSPERVERIPPYAYFPFGAGPRVCIGNTFATMEMVLIVASVLQKFRVSLAADQGAVEPEPLIAIRPKGGLRVTLAARGEMAAAGKTSTRLHA